MQGPLGTDLKGTAAVIFEGRCDMSLHASPPATLDDLCIIIFMLKEPMLPEEVGSFTQMIKCRWMYFYCCSCQLECVLVENLQVSLLKQSVTNLLPIYLQLYFKRCISY